MKKWSSLAFFLWPLSLLAQSSTGELRLAVADGTGSGLRSTVELVSESNGYQHTFVTEKGGQLDAKRLPFGVYRIRVKVEGFAPFSELMDIRSAVPVDRSIRLEIAPVSQSVSVSASTTPIDPYRAGSVNEIGSEAIENRLTALPGRSIQDLVNSEPGWLYEGNAVLHPRGAEYQTQFVLDGIPLTDNRSPGFGPSIEAEDVEALRVYTAGIPAEYGRKLGGVVEVETLKSQDPGLSGQVTLFGGGYATAGISTQGQYAWKGNTLGLSADGNRTDHYLNPVVPENYTNNGTTAGFSVNYERDFTTNDRLTLIVRHDLARYAIPNELVQETGAYVPDAANTVGCPSALAGVPANDCVFIPGGQFQTSDNLETMGSMAYQHVFSSHAVGVLRGMSRDHSSDFDSNPLSWPLIATQHNDFKEIYFAGSVSVHQRAQEWKAGIESDTTFLHEDFRYTIPDCTDLNSPQCPVALGVLDAGASTFAFTGKRPDLEQSAYAQDAVRLGKWTVDAGLRWDHYQLLVNQNAVSPRLTASRYFQHAAVNVHASYDRVFETPSFENILLSSSPAAESLDTSVPAVQLPVQPSHGNYYEIGATKALFSKLRLDANLYRRNVNNYADDSQILSTGISFPIAFRKGIVYGAEAKLEAEHWGKISGFVSYSYMVGNVWNPVTGGLFLGDDAASAIAQQTGHFPDSQDQRNTLRARVRFEVAPRLWIAAGNEYNSGLPFAPDQTAQQYASEYGQIVIQHLNFDRDRIRPYLTENLSVGVDLYRREKRSFRLQTDLQNVSNTLELIDFGGLFSGNAVGPSRQVTARLVMKY